MKIRVEYTEKELKELVLQDLESKLGDVDIDLTNILIEVKSKQNYKSEWEIAEYRAVFEKH